MDPDPLNANNEEDDKAGGAVIDEALAALEQAEGGGAKDDHPPPEGGLKEAVEPQEKEAKAEKDQAREEVEELGELAVTMCHTYVRTYVCKLYESR